VANGRDDNSESPAPGRRAQRKALANEHRLRALGEAVDQRSGVTKRPRRRSWRRKLAYSSLALVVVIVAGFGAIYWYANHQFDRIHKIRVNHEVPAASGQPYNILMIGSDSRAGLSGLVAAQTGATTGQAAGQRSDVVKIIHVDPNAGTISIISIPRDTMVTLLANQSLYGNYNRINVNFGNGPSLLAQTITANFGITIHQTIVVSFAGLINAADALGGVYLDFRYPSWDPYSGLRILHPGCQLVTGFQALAVTRSRHFYYNVDGAKVFPKITDSYDELQSLGWEYDGSSDFGRIDRQNAFLRGMIDQAKKLYNPFKLNAFVSALPQGITLDQTFTLNQLIGLAERFHSINANSILTYTLPVTAGVNASLGDVLYVQEPAAQQLFVNIFGKQLIRPADPPPNAALQTPQPPEISPTTTTTTSAPVTKPKKHSGATTTSSTTTTTNPTLAVPSFDPVPCTPS